MGWLIALGVLTALALLPVGGKLVYGEGGAAGWLIAGPVRYALFPRQKKKEKNRKEKKKPEKPPKTPPPSTPEAPEEAAPREPEKAPGKGGSLTDFFPLVRDGLDLLADFRRKLRVNRLEWTLTLAGDDPCDLAVNYGRAVGAMEGLMPQLERFFVIKKRRTQILCNFEAEKTVIYARLDVTITLGRLLMLAVRYGVRALYHYVKIDNRRKGGA